MIKNYSMKLSRHKCVGGIISCALEPGELKPLPGEDYSMQLDALQYTLVSFGQDWTLVYSFPQKRRVVKEINLLELIGHPLSMILSSISKAIFIRDRLLVGTSCGHLVVFKCDVNLLHSDRTNRDSYQTA